MVVPDQRSNDYGREDTTDNEGHPRLLIELLRRTLAWLEHGRDIQERSALSRGSERRAIAYRVTLTEISMATPVHGLSLLIWTKDSKKYTRIAPTGVAALKTATCLRQSGRGSPVASRDVVRANTVGAEW